MKNDKSQLAIFLKIVYTKNNNNWGEKMENQSLTTIDLKKKNRQNVYTYIYEQKSTCKLEITNNLQMGLSTVSQNLKQLEDDGLIRKNGFYDSTGGRKADAIEIVADYKISIGVAILASSIHLVATNLFGQPIMTKEISIVFSQNPYFYKNICNLIFSFIDENKLQNSQILGISIATQGIVSSDNSSISYGKLLDNTKMHLADFTDYIDFPCRLEHDAKAAANLEIWQEINHGVVILLNENLGGAIITNGEIMNGDNQRSGLIEHISINPYGEKCYCGSNGCLETVCSLSSLHKKTNTTLDNFLDLVSRNDEQMIEIWDEYLENLSIAIANLSNLIDGKIMLSGELSPYIREIDLSTLLLKINEKTAFKLTNNDIILGSSGKFTQAIGASLYYIQEFLKNPN